MSAGWIVVLAFVAPGVGLLLAGVIFGFLLPYAQPGRKSSASERLSDDERTLRTFVDQYLRDEIDVEELEGRIGRYLQVGAPLESGGRVTRGVRVDRPDWVRQAEKAILGDEAVP